MEIEIRLVLATLVYETRSNAKIVYIMYCLAEFLSIQKFKVVQVVRKIFPLQLLLLFLIQICGYRGKMF